MKVDELMLLLGQCDQKAEVVYKRGVILMFVGSLNNESGRIVVLSDSAQ